MLLASLLAACALLTIGARAQKTREARDAKPSARKDAKQPLQKKTEAQRSRREAREAVAALKEVAEIARTFDDVYESVRAQSEAADALWPYEEQSARSILHRAWEAVNAPGAEGHVQGFGTSEDPREDALNALTTARRFVIKTAIKHDPRMAEALTREFELHLLDDAHASAQREQSTTQQTEQPTDSAATARRERTPSPAGWQRLSIARQLFEEEDFKHAAETVAPLVAEGPTLPLLKFILDLHAHDAGDADTLYLRLLASTRADGGADANDVLLLSTPFVSPDLRVSVNPDGSTDFTPLHYQNDEERSAASSLSAEARLAFYDTAASVLLRPRTPRTGGQLLGDATALYFAIGRLLPFFEREATQLAPALNARLVSLAAEIDAARRESLKAKMDVSSLAPKNPVDPLAFPLEMVAQARETKDRDFARLVVVAEAARLALWDRARAFTEEIEDGEMRRAARLVVAIHQVAGVARGFDDEEPDASERAAAFVVAADVPRELRAVGLAQVAELAARSGKRERSDELLAQAAGYAAGADHDAQRASALAFVTLSATRTGGARVWELLPAFVRAADEADELRFGMMLLEFNVGTSDRKLWVTTPDAPIGLQDVFASCARLDAARTFAEARSFKDEEMRADALLAAARAALEKNGRVVGARAR
jgi:hypothetical protein